MPTVKESVEVAQRQLSESGVREPRRDVLLLLGFSLECDRTFLLTNQNFALTDEQSANFQAFVTRRAAHEPIQYITGRQEFFGLEFEVNSHVLIPRPETEIIVEQAIANLEDTGERRFAEIGVGSGCVTLSILKNVMGAEAICGDISGDALAVANRNAERLGLSNRVEFLVSDLFAAFHRAKFPLIVSNPPYVSVGEMAGLDREVRDFEPRCALTEEGDGLTVIKRLIEEAPTHLSPKGTLIFEFGFGQDEQIMKLFGSAWADARILKDIQGIPRTVVARIN